MSKIVVGIDGSVASRKALTWAAQEAKLRNVALHVVHTWPPPYAVGGLTARMSDKYVADTEKGERRVAEDLFERELAATGIEASGVRIERELVEGPAAPTLLAAAQSAELLVIGSSRHGSLAGLVLGAVGQECAQHAPCPLVIVRTGEAQTHAHSSSDSPS